MTVGLGSMSPGPNATPPVDTVALPVTHPVSGAPIATVYVSCTEVAADAHYGGTRVLSSRATPAEAEQVCEDLATGESDAKNLAVNELLRDSDVRAALEALLTPAYVETALSRIISGFGDDARQELGQMTAEQLATLVPDGYWDSVFRGARLVIHAASPEIERIFDDPTHPDYAEIVGPIFQAAGEYLNSQRGRILATPDFGGHARDADRLREYTEYVLGVSVDLGGCEGKSSYTTTNIKARFDDFMAEHPEYLTRPVTIIGSAGGIGSDFLAYVREWYPEVDLRISDLRYGDGVHNHLDPPEGVTVIEAIPGRYNDAVFEEPGVVIPCTVGDELLHHISGVSGEGAIPPEGTVIFASHNRSLPSGREGVEMSREFARLGVTVFPGQQLTGGGTLTARLEWYFRQQFPGERFHWGMKFLCHTLVDVVQGRLFAIIRGNAERYHSSPHIEMLRYIGRTQDLSQFDRMKPQVLNRPMTFFAEGFTSHGDLRVRIGPSDNPQNRFIIPRHEVALDGETETAIRGALAEQVAPTVTVGGSDFRVSVLQQASRQSTAPGIGTGQRPEGQAPGARRAGPR